MKPVERRGQIIFWTLVGLLAADCALRIVLTLLLSEGPVDWWRGVALRVVTPMLVVCCCSGDKSFKWMTVLALTVDALNLLMPGLFLTYKLFERTPWEKMETLLLVVGLTVGEGLVRGLFFVAVALAFAFLPSLQAFWRFQREGPELPAGV